MDAVGCCLPGELSGLSHLVDTLLKAGNGSVQIILAGEGSVTVARSSECAFLDLLPSTRCGSTLESQKSMANHCRS
jgi:hypothetical protein